MMTMCGRDGEVDIIRRLLTDVYPSGIVSIVCDSYDYWHTLNVTLRELRDVILNRPGKFVVRPDSGDPIKIICGDPFAESYEPLAGTVRLLDDIFGSTRNSKGYYDLNPHVGVIYGDSITLERCSAICEGLKHHRFASTNMVFGIGSFAYQYVTRDTLGLAMKATYGVVNGTPIEIFKEPKTDSGIKKSARGLLMVYPEYANGTYGDLKLIERVTPYQERCGLLETVFLDDDLKREQTLADIRLRIDQAIAKQMEVSRDAVRV